MAKPVILSVDDDPQVLKAVVRDLRRHYGREYRILQSTDGPSALEALDELKARGEHVAIVLSDQRMPGMDGTRVLHETISRYPSAKRALLTAYSDIDAAIAAINESHIDYYLLKPWDPPEEKLYPVLTDLLEDWQASFRPVLKGSELSATDGQPSGISYGIFSQEVIFPTRFWMWRRQMRRGS